MLLLIIGQGDTDEKADLDYDQNLRNLLDRCRVRNIKLNEEKFHLKYSEVSFIGHLMTRNGLKADNIDLARAKSENPINIFII